MVKTAVKRTARALDLVSEELETAWEHDVPLTERIDLWRDGFRSEAEYLYDFDSHEKGDFLPHYHRRVRSPDIGDRLEWVGTGLAVDLVAPVRGRPDDPDPSATTALSRFYDHWFLQVGGE